MSDHLSQQEINAVLKKIRSKYTELIRYYKKPHYILDAFEERYINSLKKRINLTMFLKAEIEVVDELLEKEKQKKEQQKEHKQNNGDPQPSFVDKIFEENRRRIKKYTRIKLADEADEELEYLFGAVRSLLNDYWPALIIIFKEKKHTHTGENLNELYQKLLTHYDYTGSIPIARHYLDLIIQKMGTSKKMDYEHRYIMQETAFLLNDIYAHLKKIGERNEVPDPLKQLYIDQSHKKLNYKLFSEIFKDCNHEDSLKKVLFFVKQVIDDFRLGGIKKHY